MKIYIVIHDDPDGLWAEVPALPGCYSQGDTREELLANIKEAIECYLETGQARAADLVPNEGARIETYELEVA